MRIFILVLCLGSFLFAHKLNLFLSQEGKNIYVSTYFASGSPCQNCDLLIKSKDGKLLKEVKTDIKGEYLILNAQEDVLVEVKTKEGHGASDTLTLEDIEVSQDNTALEKLKSENQKLKSKIKMLEEKVEQNELIKMIFALLVIAGIFFVLKRVKKNA